MAPPKWAENAVTERAQMFVASDKLAVFILVWASPLTAITLLQIIA
jgi:hypothetical protein